MSVCCVYCHQILQMPPRLNQTQTLPTETTQLGSRTHVPILPEKKIECNQGLTTCAHTPCKNKRTQSRSHTMCPYSLQKQKNTIKVSQHVPILAGKEKEHNQGLTPCAHTPCKNKRTQSRSHNMCPYSLQKKRTQSRSHTMCLCSLQKQKNTIKVSHHVPILAGKEKEHNQGLTPCAYAPCKNKRTQSRSHNMCPYSLERKKNTIKVSHHVPILPAKTKEHNQGLTPCAHTRWKGKRTQSRSHTMCPYSLERKKNIIKVSQHVPILPAKEKNTIKVSHHVPMLPAKAKEHN